MVNYFKKSGKVREDFQNGPGRELKIPEIERFSS